MAKPHAFASPPPDIAPITVSVGVPRAQPLDAEGDFRVLSHDVLFAPTSELRCDACDADLPREDDGDDGGFRVLGRGVYLWVRGGEVTLEHAPLCASCASAIGMTALARWEIEEEEG